MEFGIHCNCCPYPKVCTCQCRMPNHKTASDPEMEVKILQFCTCNQSGDLPGSALLAGLSMAYSGMLRLLFIKGKQWVFPSGFKLK